MFRLDKANAQKGPKLIAAKSLAKRMYDSLWLLKLNLFSRVVITAGKKEKIAFTMAPETPETRANQKIFGRGQSFRLVGVSI